MAPSNAGNKRLIFAVSLLAALVAATVIAAFALRTDNRASPVQTRPRAAAIIDQLASTSPNPAFVWTTTTLLQQAGYTVEYAPAEQVTVDFYRELPSKGYGLVILRGHSGITYSSASEAAQEVRGKGEPFLFTSEPYGDEHPADRQSHRLSEAAYFDPPAGARQLGPDELLQAFRDSPTYFGIKADFVRSSAEGTFPRSIVILMGCNGLASDALAKAFLAKGASAVAGWDDLVTAQHTDSATSILLGHLFNDNLPLDSAVALTATEAGPDPTYGGKLALYQPD